MASALNETDKIKSVRVAMDELSRTGSLIKLPNAYYQYAQPQQNWPERTRKAATKESSPR
ncbi:hypothetical protein SSPS47_17205 [Streptomyces sp. S4.7]|nr:hypothetical protein SSPS47_17205 [Streptomyces sp. S4.7]